VDINNFLGDVATVMEVQNAKLTEEEKNHLDRELGINELDIAINQSRKKTAPVLTVLATPLLELSGGFLEYPFLTTQKHVWRKVP
jgi:hypothetical protein